MQRLISLTQWMSQSVLKFFIKGAEHSYKERARQTLNNFESRVLENRRRGKDLYFSLKPIDYNSSAL